VVTAPFRGAPQTVQSIISASLAAQDHMQVRELAERICRELRSKDYLSEALAIYHYVVANTRYTRDPTTIELVKAPYRIIDELLGDERPMIDCDDMTVLIVTLLLSLGHRVRVVTAAFANQFYKKERQYSHVFAQVWEPHSNTWITLDPVAGEHTRQMHARIVAAKVYGVA
jgi:transglutaminase-like putative cysteine protease